MFVFVFDFDGMLVLFMDDLVVILNYVFISNGFVVVFLDDVWYMVGMGVRVLLECGFIYNGVVWIDVLIVQFYQEFFVYYGVNIVVYICLFEGVVLVFESFCVVGWKFVVCINKIEWLIYLLFEVLDFVIFFDVVVGVDIYFVFKLYVEFVLGVIDQVGGMVVGLIMIGDSGIDIKVVCNVGIFVIVVDFGYLFVLVVDFDLDIVIFYFCEFEVVIVELNQIVI